MPEKKTTQMPFIQSLDRGLTILQAVAVSKQPVSLGELAELLGVDRSSAFRLAHTLRRRGFLSCPANRKDYILGSSMWYLTHHYDWNNMLVRVANQQLKSLAAQLNETAHLAIREGKNALFIDSAAVNQVLSVSGQAGELVPLYCTAHGKALLADADEAELKAIFGPGPLPRFTKTTITTLSALAKDCTLVKKRGYASDDAEYREELRCMAAPIRVENDVIVGSIGVSVPMSRFPKEHFRAYSDQICKVAQEIGILMSGMAQDSKQAS
jgi:IclR family acetate operon transcriptional repressor